MFEEFKEPTLGSYVRGDRNLVHPFGFHELSGFPLWVRCTEQSRGDGTDESVRIKVEFRFIDSKLKLKSADPGTIIDWWLASSFDAVLRQYARTKHPDYCVPHTACFDGTGRLVHV